MHFELVEQSEKYRQRQFENLRVRRNAVLRQSYAKILLDGFDEHDVVPEDGTRRLQDGQEQVEREDFAAKLVTPGNR